MENKNEVLKQNRKARLADSLIAQICIDHNMPLMTRDKDFISFEEITPLVLYP